MKQYKKSFELKNAAKDTLDGKYGLSILILFLNALISYAVQLLINNVAYASVGTVYASTNSSAAATVMGLVWELLTLVTLVVLGVMNAGIALYFLNVACNHNSSVKDLFYGFRTDSKKALILSGVLVLCEAFCIWPASYLAQDFWSSRDTRILLYTLAALAIGLCIYIPVSLGIAFVFYLSLDFPEKSTRETLALSWHIMKGHRGRLFYLRISFLPLMLLCVLSFGIGFLWLAPYMQMTYTHFFLDLMNPMEVSV